LPRAPVGNDPLTTADKTFQGPHGRNECMELVEWTLLENDVLLNKQPLHFHHIHPPASNRVCICQ